MQNVIADLHTHVPFYEKDDEAIYSSQGIVGGQLTVERGVNSIMEVANGFNAIERKEGLHFEIADFHAMVKFLQVHTISCYTFCFKYFSFVFSMSVQCTVASQSLEKVV